MRMIKIVTLCTISYFWKKDSEMSKIKITEKHDCSENNTKFIRTK